MSVYSYSNDQIEKLVGNARRRQNRFVWTGCLLLTATLVFEFLRFGNPLLRAEHWSPVFIVLFVLSVQLIRGNWKGESTSRKLRAALTQLSVVISHDGIRILYPEGVSRQLGRDEITRVEEPSLGHGLYIRSRNRYRWFLIQCSLDDYDEIKGELAHMGIPLVAKTIPPNWEEFIFVLFFCGTLLFSGFSHDVRILTGNLIIALLMAIVGTYIVRANPDNRSHHWKLIAGMFIPAVVAALALLWASKS
jgi:hypothetical protein